MHENALVAAISIICVAACLSGLLNLIRYREEIAHRERTGHSSTNALNVSDYSLVVTVMKANERQEITPPAPMNYKGQRSEEDNSVLHYNNYY